MQVQKARQLLLPTYQKVKAHLICTCCPEWLYFKLARVYISISISTSHLSLSLPIPIAICNTHMHIPNAFEMSFIL